MSQITKETIERLRKQGKRYSYICKKFDLSINQLHDILHFKKEEGEADIIRKVKEGEEEAFSDLYNRYYNIIKRAVEYKLSNSPLIKEKEDIIQDAFVKAFQKIHLYQPQDKLSFGAWLNRIAYNTMIDIIRKKKRQKEEQHVSISSPNPYQDEDGENDNKQQVQLHDDNLTPEEEFQNDQVADFLNDLVENLLNEKQKAVFKLRYYEQYSYKDICSEMDMPIGSVKASLNKVKRIAKERINISDLKQYMEV